VVGWSPYEGIELPFRPAATYLRGEKIFDGKDVLADRGNGQYVTPLISKELQAEGA
jgi:allantoinase